MEKAFTNPSDRRDFALFYLATFACFFTISQTALLSVLFRDEHMSDRMAGVILGARYVAAIIGTLCSARMMAYAGVLNTAMLGIAVMVLSFLGLQFAYPYPIPALAMRLAAGAGFGMFFPAAFLYAKNKVTGTHQVRYMAIFQTAMIIPNLFGPGVAEWYLHRAGPEWFFVVMGVPALLMTVGTWIGANDLVGVKRPATGSYLRLLRDRQISVPLVASVVIGMVAGIVYSYMALWLWQSHVNVSWFFSPYAAAALFSALVLTRGARNKPPQLVTAAAFLSVGLSAVLLAIDLDVTAAFASGVLLASGYTIILPTIIAWTCQYFPQSEQARPTALVNTLFNVGGVLGPLLVGWLLGSIGVVGVVSGIALATFLMALLAWPVRTQLGQSGLPS